MSEGNMDLGNGWTTEKLRDEILEHIWIDETGDMGGVHCMHCLGYEQGEIDRAINTVFAAALQRAKADGAREMIKIVKAHRADQRVADDLNNTVSFDSFNEVLDAITREADARAAQIEADYE